MVRAKVFVYAKPFEGMPSNENFKLIEEELPPLKDGEFLAEALYLSVDPYQRAYAARLKIGEPMIGAQVAKITKSKSKNYPVGKYVVGSFGWRTHTVFNENEKQEQFRPPPVVIPYDGSVPLSYFLGLLGMTGATSYFGFLDICKPKPGETVVVTGAAGAVGSHVGQIAKIKGCHVIGIAGSDEKLKWLKTLGFDHVINYKTDDVAAALKKAAPKGVDCFFDNVGGELNATVISQMNRFGRISMCGAISGYNDKVPSKVTTILPYVVLNELEMKGFIVSTWSDKWDVAVTQNIEWLKEGKLQYKETLTEGFGNTVNALIGVLGGDNTVTTTLPFIVFNELEMKGFIVTTWLSRWNEAVAQNIQWLKEGKLQYKETITEGFENTLNALIGVLKGDNTGKAIVKVLRKLAKASL